MKGRRTTANSSDRCCGDTERKCFLYISLDSTGIFFKRCNYIEKSFALLVCRNLAPAIICGRPKKLQFITVMLPISVLTCVEHKTFKKDIKMRKYGLKFKPFYLSNLLSQPQENKNNPELKQVRRACF